jgi:hypothetical protein
MSKNILGQTFGSVSIDLTTSNISADKLTGTTEINGTYLTANRGLTTDSNKKLVSTTATADEIEFLQGVSSNIQTQLNAKQPEITSSARLNANLINDGSISNTEFGYLDNLSGNIQTQLDAKLSSATATLVYFTNIAAQGKQDLIDSSNRLNANLIGSNGNISNTEFGYLDNLSGNIQTQLDAKQATIDSSNRLNANLIGSNGNISNTEFGYLDNLSGNIQTQINGKQATLTNTTDVEIQNITARNRMAVMTGGSGTTLSGSYSLHSPFGSIGATGYATISDNKLKHNEIAVENALQSINQLKAVKYLKTNQIYDENYTLISDGNGGYTNLNEGDEVRYEIGFIADEVMNIDIFKNSVVDSHSEDDNTTIKSLNYTDILAVAVKAIQELKVEIDNLKNM